MEESLPRMDLTTESKVTDEAGNAVIVWYFDGGKTERHDPVARLIKCGRKVHSMHKLGTLHLSKPERFRRFGEGLIRDPGEGEVSRCVTTAERIDEPEDLQEEQEFLDEVRRCASSIGQDLSIRVTSSKTTEQRGTKIRYARNCWIYCTAIEPATEQEWCGLWESMPTGYDHVDCVSRPRQFALSLGLMAAEQLGSRGLEVTSTESFGEGVVHTRAKGQLIIHGPVVYVTDPFSVISSASSNVERGLLPVFVKDVKYAAQREYRFVVWADEEPEEGTVDLSVSKAMLGSLDVEPVPHDVCAHPTRPKPTPRLSSPQSHDDRTPLPTRQFVGPDVVDQELVDPRASEVETPRADVKRGEALDSTSDWFWPDLFGRSDDPATPFSRTIDVTDYAGNPRAAAAAAALAALRGKVEHVQGERRTKAASAAWHAEPWVSHLCRRFVDPIGSVRITEDDILVISLRFPKGVHATAEMAFGPKGAHVAVVNGPKMPGAVSHSLNPRGSYLPPDLGRWLSEVGMISCVEADTHET